jgi:hypothetical protein
LIVSEFHEFTRIPPLQVYSCGLVYILERNSPCANVA